MKKNLMMLTSSVFILFATFGSATLIASPEKDVLETYSNIAEATYEDSLILAKELKETVMVLIAAPTEINLQLAKKAWIAARVPYQQTEAYRFGNPIVDDWEGKVNAWPLDEGLIDYVDFDSYGTESDENELYTANVIANTKLKINGKTVDSRNISKKFFLQVHDRKIFFLFANN